MTRHLPQPKKVPKNEAGVRFMANQLHRYEGMEENMFDTIDLSPDVYKELKDHCDKRIRTHGRLFVAQKGPKDMSKGTARCYQKADPNTIFCSMDVVLIEPTGKKSDA